MGHSSRPPRICWTFFKISTYLWNTFYGHLKLVEYIMRPHQTCATPLMTIQDLWDTSYDHRRVVSHSLQQPLTCGEVNTTLYDFLKFVEHIQIYE